MSWYYTGNLHHTPWSTEEEEAEEEEKEEEEEGILIKELNI